MMTKQPLSKSARRRLEGQVADETAHAVQAEQAMQRMDGLVGEMLVTARQVGRSAQKAQSLAALSSHLCTLLGEVEAAAEQAGDARTLLERSRQAVEHMRGLTSEITQTSDAVGKEMWLAAERSLEESCRAQAEINSLRQLVPSGNASVPNALSTAASKIP